MAHVSTHTQLYPPPPAPDYTRPVLIPDNGARMPSSGTQGAGGDQTLERIRRYINGETLLVDTLFSEAHGTPAASIPSRPLAVPWWAWVAAAAALWWLWKR